VILQYVLWHLAPSTSTILPCRLRSPASNDLLGHVARWGIRSGLLRPIQPRNFRRHAFVDIFVYRHRRQCAQQARPSAHGPTSRCTGRTLARWHDVAFRCASTREWEGVHARSSRRQPCIFPRKRRCTRDGDGEAFRFYEGEGGRVSVTCRVNACSACIRNNGIACARAGACTVVHAAPTLGYRAVAHRLSP